MKSNPSKADLHRLYTAAASFRQIAPWDWMDDGQIFGVEEPETGEIGYCSVLGALGEVFAFAVYEGDEGLRNILGLLNRAEDREEADGDFTHSQKALLASFEDRRDLSPEDVKTIRSLGLTFRGKKSWPQFRHYLPGYFPWFLDARQSTFLSIALEQALDFLPRIRQNRLCLPRLNSGCILVRKSSKDENGQIHWHDETLPFAEPKTPAEDQPVLFTIDEVGLERIRKKATRNDEIWEIGCEYAPMPAQDKRDERPYFPKMLLVLDQASGLVLTSDLKNPDGYEQNFQNHLIKMMAEIAVIPRGFLVAQRKAFEIVEPIAKALEINLERIDRLPLFTDAYQHMLRTMR